MRIIGGELRGRRLHAPKGDRTTRPITDRVKQSLFDRLIAMQMIGGHVLDLFAGTGSLGLEALSRGANYCTFVERDRSARSLLERNLADLNLVDRATVLAIDALATRWLSHIGDRPPIRVVFCDPPYRFSTHDDMAVRIAKLIERLTEVVEVDGLLVLRTDDRTQPAVIPQWPPPMTYTYGSMALHFYHTPDAAPRGNTASTKRSS